MRSILHWYVAWQFALVTYCCTKHHCSTSTTKHSICEDKVTMI